jgi:hypothetical protein
VRKIRQQRSDEQSIREESTSPDDTAVTSLIRSVAATFVTLQELRHSADYNLIESFGRVRVLQIINQAKQAMGDWTQVRDSEQARVFLTALLLHDRWGRTN